VALDNKKKKATTYFNEVIKYAAALYEAENT
jgi:hypothetical protein